MTSCPPKIGSRLLALSFLLPLSGATTSLADEERPEAGAARSITEFDDSDTIDFGWQIVDDGVMGGLSKGRAEITDEGTLRFSGDLSLENNGGFSSLRSRTISLDLGQSEGFLLRVKGDGRSYNVRAATDARYRGMEVSFSGEFETSAGEWIEVEVPFSSMKGSFRGRSLEDEVFDPSRVQRIGLILSDKKQGPFTLEVDWIRTYGEGRPAAAGSAGADRDNNPSALVKFLADDPRFQTLVAALGQAGLGSLSSAGEGLTVLAPTDEAFEKLPAGTIEKLLLPESRDELIRILSYHVAPGESDLASLLRQGEVSSLLGDDIKVSFSGGRVRINDAALVDADLTAPGGIVHAIDTVLLPPAPARPTVLTTAESGGNFSTLLAAVKAAGLEDALGGEGPFTVFAPTDEAFSAIPAETIADLLKEENRDKLTALLSTHVVAGLVRAGDALNAGTAKALSGAELSFTIDGGRLTVNGATITTIDVEGGNGIIHIIDTVLTPPPSDRAQAGHSEGGSSQTNDFLIRAVEKIVAAIEQGVPLYNSGDAAACADIYEECIISIAELSGVDDRTRRMLSEVVRGGGSHLDPDRRAWLYRRTLDGLMVVMQRALARH